MSLKWCLLALIVLAFPVTAHAQSDALKQQAKQEVTDGLAAQEAGRYDQAIAHYQRAYRLVPHPLILFNLGQAYRLSGDEDAALGYYRRYLAVDPSGRVNADARRWIAELEAAIAARAPPPGPSIEAQAKARQARARQARTMRLGGIGAGIAGGISLALGLKFGLDAHNISDRLSEHDGPWTDELLADQDRGRKANTKMIVFTSIGGVVAVAGATLFLLGNRDHEDGKLAAVPMIGDGLAGLAAVGRF